MYRIYMWLWKWNSFSSWEFASLAGFCCCILRKIHIYIYLWNWNQNLWTFVFFEFSILNLLALGGWGWFRECFVVWHSEVLCLLCVKSMWKYITNSVKLGMTMLTALVIWSRLASLALPTANWIYHPFYAPSVCSLNWSSKLEQLCKSRGIGAVHGWFPLRRFDFASVPRGQPGFVLWFLKDSANRKMNNFSFSFDPVLFLHQWIILVQLQKVINWVFFSLIAQSA